MTRRTTGSVGSVPTMIIDGSVWSAHVIIAANTMTAMTQNTMTEIELAGKQAVAKIKGEIADLITARSAGAAVKEATLDAAFVKEMLLSVAKNWNGASSDVRLEALLPESRRKELEERLAASAKELLAAGLEVGYSSEVRTGFKVGAKDGGYYISFTDESFEALMHEYLREKVSQMLFA